EGEAAALFIMGRIYDYLDDKHKALGLYDQALSLYRVTGDRSGQVTTLTNIGRVFDFLGEPHKALEHYNQALLLCRAAGCPGEEPVIRFSTSNVFSSLGDDAKALEMKREALTLFRVVGDRRAEASTLTSMGSLLHETGSMPPVSSQGPSRHHPVTRRHCS